MRTIIKFTIWNTKHNSPRITRLKSKVYRVFYNKVPLLVCLFLIPLFNIHTEESVKNYLVFLKTAGLARTGDDQRLKNLLSEAAEIDLQQRGFTTLTEEEWQKTRQAAGDTTVNSTPPPDIFAQLTINALYAENGKDLTIAFEWQNKNRNKDAYSKTSQLNDNLLYLDKLISDAITEITTKLGIKVAANHKSATGNQGNKTTDKDPTHQQTDKFEQYANLKFKATEDPGQNNNAESILPDNKANLPLQPDTNTDKAANRALKTFELELGASPFVPAGEATKITQFGLFGSFTASYLINFSYQAELGVGFYGALNYFRTTETIAPIPVMYIPLGLDLRFIIHGYLPFAFYIRASGGPALNLLLFEGSAPVNRLTAYALGGIGLTFNIGPAFGLGIDSNFIVFFEPKNPVMGFHPSAVIYYRL